jgi:hypothetical protein
MANTIQVKRSAVPAKVPTTSDLALGEIAVNTYDGKMYIKKDDGTASIVTINAGGGGSGDVVGPASATDNALARYDSTTGKLIQNSVVIVGDTGSITGVNALTAESLVINNNTALGSSNTDTLDVNARITTDLEPNANNAKDIGTNGRNWRDGFFGRTLSTVNLEVTGTTSFDGSQGTAGQVLTSAGTGATPTWTTPTTGTVTSVSALTLGTTGTDLSSTVATGTTTPVITLNVPTASAANRGALSSTDWSTFNGKQAALVSGTNIKTVNGTTLLGSGDLGTIGSAYGGTGFSTYATGDLVYASATNTLSKLTAGTNGYVLTLAGGVPTWAAASGGGTAFSPYQFIATASQTTFAVGVTLSVIQVFVSGVLQKPSTDFTVSGTDVVLTSGVESGTIVSVYVYDTFNVASTYTQAAADALFFTKTGGTLTGAVAMSSNKITGLGTPTATGDAATKDYVDERLLLAGGTMTGTLNLATGTTTVEPLQFFAGSVLTTAIAGGEEYDGVVKYFTGNTISGRGYVPTTQIFRLTANGSAIGPTINNFFGANSAINLAAGGVYEIEAYCYFTKTTAGTVTVTATTSLAPANLSGTVDYGVATGGTATGAANRISLYNSTATGAAFGASASLTTAVNHAFIIRLIVEANASASNLRINFTESAGTVTPLRGSYYKATQLPAGNTGLFAA